MSRRRPGTWGSIGLLLEGLLVLFVFEAIVLLSGRLFGLTEPYSAGRFLGFALLATVLSVLAAGLGLRARGENFVDVGLSRERFAPALALVLGLVAGVALAALAFGLERVYEDLGLPAPHLPFEITGPWSYAAFVLAGVCLGGIAEELVFRGYAFRRVEAALAKRGRPRRGTWWAVLFLSALFGLLHAYQGWTGQLEVALISLALYGVYLAVGRDLGVVIVAHATLDAIGFWFVWNGG